MSRALTALAALVLVASVWALPAAALKEPLPRKVLVLYNGLEGRTPDYNGFREGFQTVANYLGLLPEYRDAALRPLPDQEAMAGFLGVFTVLRGNVLAGPDQYLSWLLTQMRSGKKVVVAFELGALEDPSGRPADQELLKDVLAGLGLEYRGLQIADRSRLRYVRVDEERFGFERPLPPLPPRYMLLRPMDPSVQAWATVRRTDLADSEGAVVAVGPNGGLALDGYILWEDQLEYRKKWLLDPFAFVSEALGVTAWPAPAPTTLNGSRAAFSHVDGDAFGGFTALDKDAVCAQIIRDRVLARYGFPATVSVIVAEIDPEMFGSPKLVDLARDIFRLENVEPGSHSLSHPFYWSKNARAEDLFYSRHGFNIPGYEFDATREIVGSCEYITSNLAPAGKPCRVMLWSGMCEPTARQIEICDRAGILNINGGDTVINESRDSIFGVAPLYRYVDGRYQVFTGQANENILTNLWSGPYYGFKYTIESMKRTGSPRRLAAMDIYYHFYSAEKQASLKALQDVHEWVTSQTDIAPMFASDYIRMVKGFTTAKMYRTGARSWLIADYGHCLSLRFRPGAGLPDLGSCRNVLGFDVRPEGVFAHLAPDQDSALVVMSDKAPATAYLRRASGLVRDFRARDRGADLDFEGRAKGRVVVAGLEPNAEFLARGPALGKASDLMLETGPDGFLEVAGLGKGRLEIRPR
ncbi:MAG: polysaccharide deacetylase [Desulfovibrionaceae bacterium]|nr:polysaccharide deacetylase [Desulfovibrionaceae bacterium]